MHDAHDPLLVYLNCHEKVRKYDGSHCLELYLQPMKLFTLSYGLNTVFAGITL